MRQPASRKRCRYGAPGVGITKRKEVIYGSRLGTVVAVVKGAACVRWPSGRETWHYLHHLRVKQED